MPKTGRKYSGPFNQKLLSARAEERKKEEEFSRWKSEENQPEENGFLNRHFPTTFIPPLTAFVPGCNECLFECNGYIYLLDINGKRVGTLVRGDRFIQLTPRYQKFL